MSEREFRIAYAPGVRQLLGMLGCGPTTSGARVSQNDVRVWLGWAFQVTIPRHAIAVVEPDDRTVVSVGVHGWHGTWLVNGSRRDLVRIELGAGVHARFLGRSVPLTSLLVSVQERDEFIRLIRPPGPGPNTARVARVRRIRLPSPVLKPGLAGARAVGRQARTVGRQARTVGRQARAVGRQARSVRGPELLRRPNA